MVGQTILSLVSVLLVLVSVNAMRELDANAYLEKFGYMETLSFGQLQHSSSESEEAVRMFQKFSGLEMTGRLDKATMEKMQQPRCGMPDMVRRNTSVPSGPQNFSTVPRDRKWGRNDLTYRITQYTPDLPESLQNTIMADAFRNWANVAPLSFRQITNQRSDLDMFFANGVHGDALVFDGRGGILAHAFYPRQGVISGDAHFDEGEQWTANTHAGINLEIVATHEFGHSLGLEHSNIPAAIMAPFYTGYDPNYSLHPDDIAGIRFLYGAGSGTVDPIGSDPTTPPTTAPTTARTSAPTMAPTPDPEVCSLTFDAIFEDTEGLIGTPNLVYGFKNTRVYIMDSTGIIGDRAVGEVFSRAPIGRLSSAVYDRELGEIHLFRRGFQWTYTVSPGESLPLARDQFRRLGAPFRRLRRMAIQWQDGRMFLFDGSQYSQWEDGRSSVVPGYPKLITGFWVGAPNNMDAGFHSQDGFTYFFRGQQYYKYSNLGVLQADYPKSILGAWLGCGPSSSR